MFDGLRFLLVSFMEEDELDGPGVLSAISGMQRATAQDLEPVDRI